VAEGGKIKSLLTKKIVVLDGAMGTELQKGGMPGGVCPEKWCLDNPQLSATCTYPIRKRERK